MKTASVQEIKQELGGLKPSALIALCLRLARFKKENKELLTYLLFDAQDEAAFIRELRIELEADFDNINTSQLYFARKSLRRMVRTINKYCRYSTVKASELELRLFFCQKLALSGISITQNAVILNLYRNQQKKIAALLATLHDDIRYDYEKDFLRLPVY